MSTNQNLIQTEIDFLPSFDLFEELEESNKPL